MTAFVFKPITKTVRVANLLFRVFRFPLLMGVSVFCGIVALEHFVRERQAKVLIRTFDEARLDLAEVVHEDTRHLPVARDAEELRRQRFRPRNLQRMAAALADAAYFQFGYRDRSEANELITRKFMRDLLEEYKSLRDKDKSSAIDVALGLSFLPSRSLQYSNGLRRTWTYSFRSNTRAQSLWAWAFWPIPEA